MFKHQCLHSDTGICQTCFNYESKIGQIDALIAEKDKEIARLRTNVLKFLDTELCDAHFQIAKKQSFDEFFKTQKEAGCRMCLSTLLERRTSALRKISDTYLNAGDNTREPVLSDVVMSEVARQALQDDGKEKI